MEWALSRHLITDFNYRFIRECSQIIGNNNLIFLSCDPILFMNVVILTKSLYIIQKWYKKTWNGQNSNRISKQKNLLKANHCYCWIMIGFRAKSYWLVNKICEQQHGRVRDRQQSEPTLHINTKYNMHHLLNYISWHQ